MFQMGHFLLLLELAFQSLHFFFVSFFPANKLRNPCFQTLVKHHSILNPCVHPKNVVKKEEAKLT